MLVFQGVYDIWAISNHLLRHPVIFLDDDWSVQSPKIRRLDPKNGMIHGESQPNPTPWLVPCFPLNTAVLDLCF